ncbi:MAG: hypothetical protein QOH97_3962 [Actinoplanes sp.]|nr:hypothetical protein [Actinoplanes sp.]
MPVTVLSAGDSLPTRASALEIGWQIRGERPDQVIVAFEVAGERAAVHVQHIGPQNLLLTGWSEAVALVARPTVPGAVFVDGVGLDVQITVRSDNVSGDQIVLPPFDVSSTRAAHLLTVTPAGDGCIVAVSSSAGSPAARLDPGSLVQRAAWSARRQSGTQTLPDHLRRTVSVAVDQSASMLPHHRSGAVQSLLEMLFGVNLLCGTAEAVPVWSLESPPRRLSRSLDRTTVLGYADAELSRGPFSSGSTLAPLIEQIDRSGTGDACVVMTDGVPADLDAVTTALSARTRPVTWHLLAIATGPDDPAVQTEPWRDELRALGPAVRAGFLTVASVSPGGEPGWLADDLTSADRLDLVVGALGLTSGDRR